jgi:hypothetical protein
VALRLHDPPRAHFYTPPQTLHVSVRYPANSTGSRPHTTLVGQTPVDRGEPFCARRFVHETMIEKDLRTS